MNIKDFYAFCREHRSTEPSLASREALYDVYSFMRECNKSKKDLREDIEQMIQASTSEYNRVAYQFVLNMLYLLEE
jgi:hypothetical protein